MDRAFAELEAATAAVEAMKDELRDGVTAATFETLMRALERTARAEGTLGGYAELWTLADGESTDAWALASRADAAIVEAENRISFVTTWWTSLDDATAADLLPGAGDAAYYFASLRRLRPYSLPDEVERAIRVKDAHGITALLDAYAEITGRLTFEVAVDGKAEALTRGELTALTRDSDPTVRAAAYAAQSDAFAPHRDVLARIYIHAVGNWVEEGVGLRGYASPMAVRNVDNDLPDDVVEAMLAACRENVAVHQRYFRLKATWLGVPTLSRSDVYAPLDPISVRMPYDGAAGLVRDALADFSPRLGGAAAGVLQSGHVDSEVRPEKAPVGRCMSIVPDRAPWITLNYTGGLESVETLAHETGHAVHAVLASGHSVLTWSPPSPLAETASIFSQMLVARRLLTNSSDPALRRYLLGRAVDTSYTAIPRQAYFTLFEREAHRLVLEGQATPDGLCDVYFGLLQEQFGASVELDSAFRWEWITIPHLYETPFYCYSYAFGQLLALALMHEYDVKGAEFVPRFVQILERGGTKAPMEILEEAGFDVGSKEFWQGGFDVISGMIDELERLGS